MVYLGRLLKVDGKYYAEGGGERGYGLGGRGVRGGAKSEIVQYVF